MKNYTIRNNIKLTVVHRDVKQYDIRNDVKLNYPS